MIVLNLGYVDGSFHVISRLKSLVLNCLAENYFYDSLNAIKTVTAEELHELSNKYLSPKDFFELGVI